MIKYDVIIDAVTKEAELKYSGSTSDYLIYLLPLEVSPSITPTPSTSSLPTTPSITPTFTPTPTPTPSTVVYTKCAEESPYFNGYSEDQIGTLTVGELLLTTGVLGDYVIEWRLNSTSGTQVFVTGNAGNTDPDIQAFHPIDSELVQSGELYPVIRYITIDGIKYSSFSNLGYSYSPDLLTCLPSITVISMSCSNGTEGTYGHTVVYYNTTQPSQLANRTLTYQLNTDGSSKQIAYIFFGFAIADRITINYCTTGGTQTVIDDWAVGTDCIINSYASTPKLFSGQYIKRVLSLTGFTYQSGDYLLFDTFPSYNDPGNTDTNWQLQIKCFSGDNLIDFGFQPNTVNDIDTGATMNLVWNSGDCRYDLTVVTGEPRVPISYNSDIYTYLLSYGVGSWDWNADQTIFLNQYTGTTAGWMPSEGYGVPYILNGVLNIKLTGDTHNLVYTFTDAIDYNHYKTGYTTNITSPDWTNWSSDVNNIHHYKFILDVFRVSMTSGDTSSTNNLYIDHESVFTFDDDNKTISILLAPQTGVYSGSTCDKSENDIYWVRQYINQVYSGTTWNVDTIWGTQYPFPFMHMEYYPFMDAENTFQVSMEIIQGLLDDSTPLSPEWYLSYGYWTFTKIYLKLVADNIADPLNNYSVYSGLNPDGSLSNPPVLTLIKKVP